MRRLSGQLTAAAAALLLLAPIAGCGGPDELSRTDAANLNASREDLDDAIDTEETLRTSKEEARKLRSRVRKIVASGALEGAKLDEFGLAALGQLNEAVPSLVLVRDGSVKSLDRPATAAFLRYAETDAARALLGPVREEVDLIEKTVERSDAAPDTRIPPSGRTASGKVTVERYLREAEGDLAPIWPQQARRLRAVRDDL